MILQLIAIMTAPLWIMLLISGFLKILLLIIQKPGDEERYQKFISHFSSKGVDKDSEAYLSRYMPKN